MIRFSRISTLAALLGLGVPLAAQAGPNLVVNGGFEAGNTGFASGYTYVAPTPSSNCYPQGVYTVGANPNDCHNLWASFGPHSGSLMLIVNGGTTSNVNVWQESSITVLPHANYEFTAWVASNYSVNPAVLDFSANGAAVGSPFTASTTAGLWQKFTGTWNSGSATSVLLTIVDTDLQPDGNDFSLDDISFSPVPEPASVALVGVGLAGLGVLRRRRKAA